MAGKGWRLCAAAGTRKVVVVVTVMVLGELNIAGERQGWETYTVAGETVL